MVPLDHVAGLAGGGGGRLRQNAALLEQRADAVLGGGVHLPLRVVEAHVAGLAGLGLTGFLQRESVTGVAGVARGQAEAPTLGLELADLRFALGPELVAAAAALHALHHGHRLGVGAGHGLHRRPGQVVLALLELGDLLLVALGAGGRSGDLRQLGGLGELCSSPWHTSQPTPTSLCRLVSQSATSPGVIPLWQSTHVTSAATGSARASREIIRRPTRSIKHLQAVVGRRPRGYYLLRVVRPHDRRHTTRHPAKDGHGGFLGPRPGTRALRMTGLCPGVRRAAGSQPAMTSAGRYSVSSSRSNIIRASRGFLSVLCSRRYATMRFLPPGSRV